MQLRRREVAGTSIMDKTSAIEFRDNVLNAIRELTSALNHAERSCSKDEMALIKKNIGRLIAGMDDLLREAVYKQHPELDHLS